MASGSRCDIRWLVKRSLRNELLETRYSRSRSERAFRVKNTLPLVHTDLEVLGQRCVCVAHRLYYMSHTCFVAEHHAVSGQIILSKDAWGLISTEFTPEHTFDDDYVRLDMSVPTKSHVKKKNMTAMLHSEDMEDSNIEFKIKQYITGAVLPNLNPEAPDDEKWGNELRKVCVMFVNLGIKEQQLLAAARYDEAMKDVHEVLCEVQRSVYQYEGAINKFLMDDKGSTLIACFGLPPGAHEDNCERGKCSFIPLPPPPPLVNIAL